MKQLRIPIVVVFALIMQTSGFIWWTAQQAATITILDEEVRELTSRVAAEEQFNLKRDVADLKLEIEEMDDVDDRIEEIESTLGIIADHVATIDEELVAQLSSHYESRLSDIEIMIDDLYEYIDVIYAEIEYIYESIYDE